MRRIVACLMVGLAATTLAGPTVAAQQASHQQSRPAGSPPRAPPRGSFWIGGGLGSAMAEIACNICVPNSKSILSGYVRVGFTATPNLLIGLEGTGGMNSEDSVSERLAGLSVVAYAYPTSGGFYIKGGLGLLDYRAGDDVDEFTSRVFSAQVGVGYEFRVTQSFSVLSFVNLLASTNGDLDYNGARVAEDMSVTLLQFGLGVTVH